MIEVIDIFYQQRVVQEELTCELLTFIILSIILIFHLISYLFKVIISLAALMSINVLLFLQVFDCVILPDPQRPVHY